MRNKIFLILELFLTFSGKISFKLRNIFSFFLFFSFEMSYKEKSRFKISVK